MNVFEDKTQMPSEPDISVSSVKVPGEILSGANRDMKAPGLMKWPNDTQHVARPRFGHKV